MTLGHRDVDLLLAVLGEAAAGAGNAQPFELPVIERLQTLVKSDRGCYFEYRIPATDLYRTVSGPDVNWSVYAARVEPASLWPLHDGHWKGAMRAAKWSDFVVGRSQRLRHPWYVDDRLPRLCQCPQ